MTSPIAPGAHIELRDAVWRVVRIDQTSTGSQAWRCVGISEIVRDQDAIFLEELEPKVRVLDPRDTTLERDLSAQHRAGVLYVESLLREVPPPDDGLYMGHRAAMDVLDFQLEPTAMALERPRARILIADAVGLGKTLEAGILLSELIRRGRARRILVVATKAMLTQFQKEMWGRFTIPLVRLDSVGLQRIRADIPTHHNPFYYFDRAIVSIDTLKQNNWFRRHVEQARWDVIVIDEAHNVATRGHGRSQRAQIADVLANNCDHLILLSATPHDGKAESFASLMNMLDPTAIVNPSEYTKEEIKGLYVRRFKKDVREQLGQHIPQRRISKARANASAAEERAYEVLAGLSLQAIDGGKRSGAMLFRTTLEKALFSSPAACLQTVRGRIGRVEADPKRVKTHAADLEALRELEAAVAAIEPEEFSRYATLLEVIRKHLKWKPSKKDDRLVVFTERRETLEFLRKRLTADLKLKEGQCEALDGDVPDTEQGRIVEAFGQLRAKVRLLLATDVASEGLNLHYLCHKMVHFDMPWSLMVFQQRNGRVDRYGQEHEPHIVYLMTESDNAKVKGDTRILELLADKSEQAEANIGDPSAFMNQYDVEEEEAITAQAIEDGKTAEQFEAQLEGGLVDPFALIFQQAARGETMGATRGKPLSLFESDFDFLAEAVDRLRETDDLKAEVRPDDGLVELRWTEDLRRRYRKLPAEVRPKDGVVVLTADPDRMQRAINEARKQEDSWPLHQYLWANSPVLQWARDRLRGAFGRHTAPVMLVPALGGADRSVVVVSGLLANRRGQPLVHRWYAVAFEGAQKPSVEAFSEFLERVPLSSTPLPNRKEELPTEELKKRLAPAIDAVAKELKNDRKAFVKRTRPKLDEELERLATLEQRRLAFIDGRFEGRTGKRAEEERGQRRRRAKGVFKQHQEWIEDAMTLGDEPFFEVVAVLVGGAR